MKYRLPITLWSVVVTHFTTVDPGAMWRVVAGASVVRNMVDSVAALIGCSLSSVIEARGEKGPPCVSGSSLGAVRSGNGGQKPSRPAADEMSRGPAAKIVSAQCETQG